jgi:3-oxoacyl-[acyl-carrier protein] reductase
MNDGRFAGKVAVVTGAAQGIGETYARRLAAEGAGVVVADVAAEKGALVAKQITADGGRALFLETDVASPESAEAMAAAAVAEFGGIDLLVNNAAIYYRKFMSVNMDGALVMTRACLPHMKRRGGGAIVNQSSTAAWLYSGFYGLAKVAINGLTQQLAHELGWFNIRVNAIAPGPTDTEATRTVVHPEYIDKLTERMALKRLGTADDMAGTCLFLLSDEASWITGQIINVDGGQVFRA